MRIISVANYKGGVGKTSSVASIGMALSMKGKKVLLLDLDGQSNLTLSFGIRNAPKSIYDALIGKSTLQELIRNISENLDIIPSSIALCHAEVELSKRIGRELILRNLLKPLKGSRL